MSGGELEGLQPGTTYNYRVVATNGEGASYGAEESFTTGTFEGMIIAPVAPPRLLAYTTMAVIDGREAGENRRPATSKQRLGKALKVCRRKHSRGKRVVCDREARRKYGVVRKGV